MGRVHKKKLAQYKDSEGADDEQSVASKDESGRGDEDKDDDKSANHSDTEDLTAGDSKKADSEQEDDSDADGGDSDEEKPTKNGKRAVKRKSASKKAQKNDSDAEDDADANENGDAIEENGGTPAKRGRKSGGGKKKATPPKGGRKTKTPSKNDDEEIDEKNDDNDEAEEEYEVHEVVGHKIEKGVTFYLIRWKGYTKDDDTWESEETLSCQDLIDKYNKKNNTSKSSKSSTPGKKTENDEKRKGRPATKKSGKEGKKEEDPEKEWEVEKIIDYAEEKDGRVFRIRWKGYGPKGDTWEPEKNLSCADLIDKFMKKMNSQKDVSFKELRETPKKTKRLVNETTPRSDPSARKSKRSAGKKRIMYADSDE